MYQVYLVAPKEVSIKESVISFEKVQAEGGSENRLVEMFTKRIPENIGIGAIAQYLMQNNVVVKCVNMAIGNDTIAQIVDDIIENPPIIGISIIYDLQVYNAVKLVAKLRYRGYKGHITLGGTFISLAYDRFLKKFNLIDSIIIGDGEVPFLALYRALTGNGSLEQIPGLASIDNSGEIRYIKQNYLENHVFSTPIRDTLDYAISRGLQVQTALIVGSRGCNNNCIYCSAPNMRKLHNKVWIGRHPVELVNEIEQLINKYHVKYLYFCDDNFCGYGQKGLQHLRAFIREMKKRSLYIRFHAELRADAELTKEDILGLKSVGLDEALIGIESGVSSCLLRWRKNTDINDNQLMIDLLRECGVKLAPAYILIDPFTTLDELEQSYDFLFRNGLYLTDNPWYLFNQMIVYPGTELETLLINKGIIVPREVRPYTLHELQNDGNIRHFCQDISVVEYEIVSSEIRFIWNSLRKAVDEVVDDINIRMPVIFHSISNRETVLEYLPNIRNWRKNIGRLLMNFLKKAIEWGKNDHNAGALDVQLSQLRDAYDNVFLSSSFTDYLNLLESQI